MADDNYEPPKETPADFGHAAVRSLAGAIPYFGQTGIELFNRIVSPPLEQRLNDWRHEITNGLRNLEEQERCSVSNLAKDEEFIDTLLHASQAAILSSQKKKREALRNTILNSALPNAPGATKRLIFVQFIGSFTTLHLWLLLLLDDPKTWFAKNKQDVPKGSLKTLWPVIRAALPDADTQQALCERVCAELNEKGLLIASSLRKDVARFPFFPDKPREDQPGYRFADELPRDGTAPYSGSPTSLRNWTTELGRQFLEFIASPLDD